MSLNKVMLIGNVGKDPDIRYIEGNSANGENPKVASITLATSERYRDRNGAQQERTEWHNIVAWRGLADIVEKYVKKGTQLYVEGKIRTRQWTDQSGNKRYTTEIIADNLQLLGRRADNPGSQQGQYQQPSYQQSSYQQPRQAPAAPAMNPQRPAPVQQVPPVQPNTPAPSADIPDMPEDDLPF